MVYEVTTSNVNKDKLSFVNNLDARRHYLNMWGNFKSKLPAFEVTKCPERKDLKILDFAKGPCGLKAYAAEKFISETPLKHLAYASPRVGHAPEAIAYLCEVYNKKCTFFAAASKEITPHQAVVTAYKGCDLRFVKIPAMPTLNHWIKAWCDKYYRQYLPFGLSGVKLVTAGIVNIAEEYSFMYGQPPEFYCAVSTGTMVRGLQIGWDSSKAFGVAVARNIKDTEKGNAEVITYHKSFYKKADYMPKFDTTATYDAKAYKFFLDNGKPGSVFINVGSDKQIEKRLEHIPDWKLINSERKWKDMGAFSYA